MTPHFPASGRSGSGTETFLAKGTTVFDDGPQDTLSGGDDKDWFFNLLGEDKLVDKRVFEQIN
jgi:hypothetical protein